MRAGQIFRNALTLHRKGRFGEAEALCRQLLKRDAGHAPALNLLGNLALRSRRNAQALEYLERAAAIAAHPEYLANLGEAYLRTGRLSDATTVLSRAVELDPRLANAWCNLGIAEQSRGDLQRARDCLDRALSLEPGAPLCHRALGTTLYRQGNLERAEHHLQKAVSLAPSSGEAHFELAMVLFALGSHELAVEHYQTGLRHQPKDVAVHSDLGFVLATLQRLDESVAILERAIELDPTAWRPHANLGTALWAMGRVDAAVPALRRAVECAPGSPEPHSAFLYVLPFLPDFDDASILSEARRWNERHATALSSILPVPHRIPDLSRRLRIGYVSSDFRDHVQALFMLPLLEHHDRRSFEIFCYSNVHFPDDVTDQHRLLVDGFRDIARVDDEDTARRIREDEIDILVDLTMHMADNRLRLFAHRPAPVQVSWLAYPGTTGVAAIDYRLTDPYIDPPALALPCSERSRRLPDTFWCFRPVLRPEQQIDPGPLPALRRGSITFGCLTNFSKTNEQVFGLWARVLEAVEGSRLMLLAPAGSARNRVSAVFERAGVAPERIEFVSHRLRADYLRSYQDIDIALDTFPYNGHTTSLDAWWMGVPVLSLVGRTIVGRAGHCYAVNLGLPEWAATDADDYVEAAVRLSENLEGLARLRAELRARMERSPLMDANRFAKNVEVAYREMWRNYCDEMNRQPQRRPVAELLVDDGGGSSSQGSWRDAQRAGVASVSDSSGGGGGEILNMEQLFQTAIRHYENGELVEAEERCRQVLEGYSNHAPALDVLGAIALASGREQLALQYCERAVELGAHPSAMFGLGEAYRRVGRLAEAITVLSRAVEVDPNLSEAWCSFGLAESARGNLPHALACLERALNLDPGNLAFHVALGATLCTSGELARAEEHLEKALAIDPGSVDAHVELARVLQNRGNHEAALERYYRTLRLDPNNVYAHTNLGQLFYELGRPDESVASLERAIELNPGLWQAHAKLGHSLWLLGRVDAAVRAFRRAVELEPRSPRAHSDLLFALPFQVDADDAVILSEARLWHERHAASLPRSRRNHDRCLHSRSRLRIGYVSGNFRDNTQALFMLSLLEQHDRLAFEIFCYSNVKNPDSITELHRARVDVFRDISHTNDEETARVIREDQIDILVDLGMHMDSRLLVFARKPAPIQVTWLAYPGTTGLEAIDYRFTDPYIDPSDLSLPASERSWQLPDTFWCYRPFKYPEEQAVEPGLLPALMRGFVTFGCFNSVAETNDAVLTLWARILKAIAGSRLLLLAPECSARRRVSTFFEHVGVEPERVQFAARGPRAEHLRRYQSIDIALDTFPYPGHVTSLDAWWMGVPVLSLVARTISGRAPVCYTRNLGLPEWAVSDIESYFEAALRFASDLPRLGVLRAELRGRMERSALMDVHRFARNMEEAYRGMWRRWCEAEPEPRLALAPSTSNQLFQSAVELYSKGRLTEAEAACQRILEGDAEHAQALDLLGVLALGEGRDRDAVEYLQRATKTAEHPQYLSNLGEAYRRLGRLGDAIDALSLAVELEPGFAEAWSNLGLAEAAQENLPRAVSCFERALELKPDVAIFHRALGAALSSLGDLEKAQQHLETAVALTPNSGDAHFELAVILKVRGACERALVHYRAGLCHSPDGAAVHPGLEELESIEHLLDRAVERTPLEDPSDGTT